MIIGIFGANGFIGSELCSAQLLKGNTVFAICNKNTNSVPIGCNLVSVAEAYKIYFDQLFVSFGGHSSTNTEFVKQTQYLYEVVLKFKFKKIIFISSIAVYGNHSKKIELDSCYCNPSSYGLSKLSQEFCIKNCDDYIIVRPTYVYGNGMKTNSLLPMWIQQAKSKSLITIFGDGNRKQDYLHVDDLVNLCVVAGNSTLKCQTIIAASGKSFTNNFLAAEISRQIPETVIQYAGEDLGSSFEFDISITTSLYKWLPTTDFISGLKTYIKYADTNL